MRSLILVDVDGVLQPLNAEGIPEGWSLGQVQSGRAVIHVLFKPSHGEWLRQLAFDTGAELAWASRWGGFASVAHGNLLKLPVMQAAPTLPSIPKPDATVPWTTGRPFVWFDDEDDIGKICGILTQQPHLVIKTDPDTGLTEENIAEARRWLLLNTPHPHLRTQRIYRSGTQFHEGIHSDTQLHDGYWKHYHDEQGMVAVY